MTAPPKLSRAEQAAAAIAAADYHWYGPMLTLEVYGLPKPKGSLRFVTKRFAKEQVEGSPVWKADVMEAVRRRLADPKPFEGPFPLVGPLAIDITLTVPKPKTAPKLTRTYPDSQSTGDGDKHERNVWDALKQAGAIEDDSKFIDWSGRKTYPGEHPQALDVPGAVIRVYRVGAPRV